MAQEHLQLSALIVASLENQKKQKEAEEAAARAAEEAKNNPVEVPDRVTPLFDVSLRAFIGIPNLDVKTREKLLGVLEGSSSVADKFFDALVFSITQNNLTNQIIKNLGHHFLSLVTPLLSLEKQPIWKALTTLNVSKLNTEQLLAIANEVENRTRLSDEKYDSIRNALCFSLKSTGVLNYENCIHWLNNRGYLYVNRFGLVIDSSNAPNIKNWTLDAVGAIFEGMSPNFTDVNLERAIFRGLYKHTGRLKNVNLTGAVFEDSSFYNCWIDDSVLSDIDLTETDLNGAELTNVTLIKTRMLIKGPDGCRLVDLNELRKFADFSRVIVPGSDILRLTDEDVLALAKRFDFIQFSNIFYTLITGSMLEDVSAKCVSLLKSLARTSVSMRLTDLERESRHTLIIPVKKILELWHQVNSTDIFTYSPFFKIGVKDIFYDVVKLFVETLTKKEFQLEPLNHFKELLLTKIDSQIASVFFDAEWKALKIQLEKTMEQKSAPQSQAALLVRVANDSPRNAVVSDDKGKAEEVEIESDDDVVLPMPKRNG